MSWEVVTEGKRWSWTGDDVRHLLALVGEQLREVHEVPDGPVTVHVYEQLSGWAERGGGVGPLTHARHLRTYEVAAEHAPWVRALDDRELFEWLESAGYAS